MATPREFSFTYGSTSIPGTFSGCAVSIHDVHEFARTSREFSFKISILLKSAPGSPSYVAAVAALEAALSEPDDLLRLTLTDSSGTGNLISLDPSNQEAWDVEAEISKPGTIEVDSRRSRLYVINIAGQLPWTIDAPGAGRQGLRELSHELEFSPSRRQTLRISGEYTQQAGGSSASAQYTGQIEALYDSIVGTLTGNWPDASQPRAESRSLTRTGGSVSFSREYREIVLDEGLSAIDDPDITDQKLIVTKSTRPQEDAFPGASVDPVEVLKAVYTISVDHTATKDLFALYENRARGWIESRVLAATTRSKISLLSEVLIHTQEENTFTAELEFEAAVDGAFEKFKVETTTDVDYGEIISKTWPTKAPADDLDPTPAYVYQGPKTVRQTITTTLTTVGDEPPASLTNRGSLNTTDIEAPSSGLKIVRISTSENQIGRRTGVNTVGDLIDYTDQVITEIIEVIVDARAAAA